MVGGANETVHRMTMLRGRNFVPQTSTTTQLYGRHSVGTPSMGCSGGGLSGRVNSVRSMKSQRRCRGGRSVGELDRSIRMKSFKEINGGKSDWWADRLTGGFLSEGVWMVLGQSTRGRYDSRPVVQYNCGIIVGHWWGKFEALTGQNEGFDVSTPTL